MSFTILTSKFFIISIIIWIYILYKYYKLYKENNSLKQNLAKLSAIAENKNFNNDMEFLNYIVGFKTTIYANLILESEIGLSKGKLLNDDDLNRAVEQVTIDVMKAIGESYKATLKKYFKDDTEIQSFIAEFILEIMTSKIGKANNDKIKKINTSKFMSKFNNNVQDNHGSVEQSKDIK